VLLDKQQDIIMKDRSLYVILKTVEICLFRCKYCYFFRGVDDSFRYHPPIVSGQTILEVADFLKNGCTDLNISSLTICLHGGEPLIQNKRDFDWMCSTLRETLSPVVSLEFVLQTNGILVDEEWINLFKKYNIKVGVSFDGPKEYHDQYRVDANGHGTHDRVVEKIRLLNSHPLTQDIGGAATLSVINPNFDPVKIYQYLVIDVGLKCFDFLLPDSTHDNPPPYPPQKYSDFLNHLFDAWTTDDNPDIRIRFFEMIIRLFLGQHPNLYPFGPINNSSIPMITISSDSSLSAVDEYASSIPEVMRTSFKAKNTKLKDFMDLPLFHMIDTAEKTLPKKCESCLWKNLCNGGPLHTRYSRANGFDQPSIYCECFNDLYAHIASYILKNGSSTADDIMKMINLKGD
jgi:uncharacterized protein